MASIAITGRFNSIAASGRLAASLRAFPTATGGSATVWKPVATKIDRSLQGIRICAGQKRWQSTDTSPMVYVGSKVSVDFKVTHMENGTVLDSSEGKGPLVFVCGEGRVMGAVDMGVIGMGVGETKTIPGDMGFGPLDPKKRIEVPIEKLPKDIRSGTQVQMQDKDGAMQRVTVVALRKTTALIDFNHPLAGQPLLFTVTLLSCDENVKLDKLVVETLSSGDGKTYPKQGDTLTMHYTGSLLADGVKFDCSRDRGKPFTVKIGVGQVIQGWDEGIVKMSLGERAMLRIPADLGYGAQGAGGVIPPNADLLFDVELIEIS